MKSNETNRSSLAFTGNGLEYFILFVKNQFLTIVTLGFYSFKAGVNIKRYLWSHTTWQGQSFSFSGKPMDQVRGITWLLGMAGALFAAAGFFWVAGAGILSIPFVYLGIALIAVRMKFGGFRYRVRNTVYRGMRGNISPDTFQPFLNQSVKGAILTVLTLGIYRSYNHVALMKIKWNNTTWGRQKFSYHGDGTEFLMLNLKGFFLVGLTFGIYSPWLIAKRMRYHVGNIRFMGVPMECTVTGGQIFLHSIRALILIPLTLGLAGPWMLVSMLRMLAGSIAITGPIDFSRIESDARAHQSTSGDMAGDALDLDADFDLAV